ncbi:MAG: DNA mismatch repair protein MutT [Bacteroidales bacterium]|nr:DNA mismatch repair protein MutT [Bacteroidales bacterium]
MYKQLIPNLSVDSIVFGFDSVQLKVLLIKQDIIHKGITYHDYKLPGDIIRKDEDIDTASKRILKELTGLQNIFMKQLSAFGSLDRLTRRPRDLSWLISINHPDERVITIPYFSLINLTQDHLALTSKACWTNVDNVSALSMIFDHKEIFEFALESLRNELRTKPIAFELLPPKFSLSQLQKVYEILFEINLDKRNFRKKILSLNYIVPLKEKETGVKHRPALLYMFSQDIYQKLKTQNFDFTI